MEKIFSSIIVLCAFCAVSAPPTGRAQDRPDGAGSASGGAQEAALSARERAQANAEDDRAFLQQYTGTASRQAAPAIAKADPPSAEEAAAFVGRYLEAATHPTPREEVDHYADKVAYFDSGEVTRAFIERDQERYYQRWPQRSFVLVDPPKIVEASGNEALVTFRIRYRVEGPKQAAEGQTENAMRLQRFPSGLKITSIRERRVADR